MKKINLLFLITILIVFFSHFVSADNEQHEIKTYIDWLKSVQPGKDDNYIRNTILKMEQQWSFFDKNHKSYATIIHQQLKNELSQKKVSQLVLLELSLYLARKSTADDRLLLLETLKKIDIQKPVTQQFSFLYYQLLIVLSQKRTKDLLPVLDAILLPNKNNAFQVFQPKGSQDVAMYRLHAFGSYGMKTVEYLLSQLVATENNNRKEKILSVLRYACTKECNAKIYDFVKNGAEHMILVHATFALLDTGGPEGKDLFLKIPISNYHGKSADWLTSEFEYAKKLNYSKMLRKFEYEHEKDDKIYSKKEFLVLMEKMILDPRTFLSAHPHDFMNSKLDKLLLLDNIQKIRKTLFLIASVHGRDYVKQANEIMNALYYKQSTTLSPEPK